MATSSRILGALVSRLVLRVCLLGVFLKVLRERTFHDESRPFDGDLQRDCDGGDVHLSVGSAFASSHCFVSSCQPLVADCEENLKQFITMLCLRMIYKSFSFVT